jgi:hypothetical protein
LEYREFPNETSVLLRRTDRIVARDMEDMPAALEHL